MTARPYQQDLLHLLERLQPGSILTIGAGSGTLFDDYRRTHPQVEVAEISGPDLLAQLDSRERYDFVLLVDTLEHLSKQAAGVLISRVRDLHARRFIAVVPVGGGDDGHSSHWEPTDLIAYGMRRVADYPKGDQVLQVYTFDLHDYKATPDWLSSQYWAHPELFGKFWW